MKEVSLSDSDRTVFSICPNCNKTGRGMKAPNYFSMAYTKRQWAKQPKCDNCETEMVMVYEIKT